MSMYVRYMRSCTEAFGCAEGYKHHGRLPFMAGENSARAAFFAHYFLAHYRCRVRTSCPRQFPPCRSRRAGGIPAQPHVCMSGFPGFNFEQKGVSCTCQALADGSVRCPKHVFSSSCSASPLTLLLPGPFGSRFMASGRSRCCSSILAGFMATPTPKLVGGVGDATTTTDDGAETQATNAAISECDDKKKSASSRWHFASGVPEPEMRR